MPHVYIALYSHTYACMHACTQSGEAVPSEPDQPSITPSSTEATSTTSATTAAVGEGEEREKEEVPSQPVTTPAPVPEPTPVKEEPKGPRPTASVPVPGMWCATYLSWPHTHTYAHTVCMCTRTCACNNRWCIHVQCTVSVYSWTGTPWSVVWTSDNRQFFFDVTSRVSLWIMPEELNDNPQLLKILENGPDGNSTSSLNPQLESYTL